MTGLANPALVYTVLWALALLLTGMRLTAQLVELSPLTVALVGANIVSFWVIYAIGALLLPLDPDPWQSRRGGLDLPILRQFVSRLLVVWAAGTVVEIVYSGGIPILWLVTGVTEKDYRNFGIPSVHGLLTAVYLFCVTALLLLFLIERRTRDLLAVAALLGWSLMLMSRGALVWALLETLAVFLLVRRISAGRMLHVAGLALAGILLFGIAGDIRAGEGRQTLRDLTTEEGRFLAEDLPSGFLWVYIYVTSPVNNVNGGIERLQPLYRPYYSTVNLLPTVIRERVYSDVDNKYAMTLVNEAFNTSTWYVNFLVDFGVRGAFVLVCGLQALIVYLYRQACRGRAWGVLAYAAVFQALALSIFSDTFTSLVTIAQVGVAAVYGAMVARAFRTAIASEPAGGADGLILQEP